MRKYLATREEEGRGAGTPFPNEKTTRRKMNVNPNINKLKQFGQEVLDTLTRRSLLLLFAYQSHKCLRPYKHYARRFLKPAFL